MKKLLQSYVTRVLLLLYRIKFFEERSKILYGTLHTYRYINYTYGSTFRYLRTYLPTYLWPFNVQLYQENGVYFSVRGDTICLKI